MATATTNIIVDGKVLPLGAFVVHRPGGKKTTVTGPDNCDVRAGSLVLTSGDRVVVVFSPGEWITLGVDPI